MTLPLPCHTTGHFHTTMSTELNSRQRATLRGMAMKLKAIIHIGKQGLSPSIVRELSIALNRDELVKVRVIAETREQRAAIMADIAVQTLSCFCGATGATASYYRQSPKKLIDPGH